MSGDIQIRLRLPEQDLGALTLGSDQPRRLRAWVAQLPRMNLGETARQLYLYIQELNRLPLETPTRLQLLEILRLPLLETCASLGQHYLKQSLVLPENAQRVAALAQALQNHLATGYKLVVSRALRRVQRLQSSGQAGQGAAERELQRNVATAMQRAASALSEVLLRSCQLYLPTPRHLWLELHQLYLLASTYALEHVQITDPAWPGTEQVTTVANTYHRALLLATARPNQLRQPELAWVFEASAQWAGMIQVRPANAGDDLFVFDLQLDKPPTCRTHVSAARASSRYVHSRALVEALAASEAGHAPSGFELPAGGPPALLAHLCQAWGAVAERSFQRQVHTLQLDICLGISAVHFHASGSVDFVARTQQAAQSEAEMEAIDLATASAAAKGGRQRAVSFPAHRCQTVNVSPGGYCLAWQGETPPQLRTGELIGLREEEHHEWTVGLVRWVRQLTHQGAQLGVELLAPRVLAVAARVLPPAGEAGDFQRVLLLPELDTIGQPATLLLPPLGFAPGCIVELLRQGARERVQLARRVSSTASIMQYEFQSLDAAPAASGDADEFHSIWASL